VCSSDLLRIVAARSERVLGAQTMVEHHLRQQQAFPSAPGSCDPGAFVRHDDRARVHQAVASVFGPRFYDWQLAQANTESRRECYLHARNLVGSVEYRELTRHLGLGDDASDSGATAGRDDDGPRWTPDDGSALRAAEPKPGYSGRPAAEPPRTEIFPRPQTEMFE